MKIIRNILLLFLIDWFITFIFYITEILVNIGKFIHYLAKTPSMPFSSFLIDILVVILVSFLLNEKFIKINRKVFIIAQIIYVVSIIIFIVSALNAVSRGILMNA